MITAQVANHTRTPWAALPEECDKPYIRIRGTALGLRYKIANVLTPVYDGSHSMEADETRANAAFIVRACNSPDALVKALKETREELRACQAVIHLDGGFDPAYVRGAQVAMKAADAALAAAGAT